MLSKSKQRLIERLRRPRSRAREGLALVEGPRGCREALRAGLRVRWGLIGEPYVTSERGAELSAAAGRQGVTLDAVPDAALRALATTETPQPVILVVEVPEMGKAEEVGPGRYLYLDQVQDPGNVGTLIRSAWGFGLSGVMLGRGSTDPWSTKALRAASGGTFHLPLFDFSAGLPDGWTRPLLYAEASDSGTGPPSVPPDDWVLAVGNEGSGVSPQTRATGEGLSISMAPGVDSLNVAVAGSILMYVLSQSGTPALMAGPTRKAK